MSIIFQYRAQRHCEGRSQEKTTGALNSLNDVIIKSLLNTDLEFSN